MTCTVTCNLSPEFPAIPCEAGAADHQGPHWNKSVLPNGGKLEWDRGVPSSSDGQQPQEQTFIPAPETPAQE